MAAEAARVAQRCEDAKESGKIDLSGCDLRQVPTCLYMLMKNTTVNTCDVSNNVIKKIPERLGQEFTAMTDLRAHHNHLTSLHDSLSSCCYLQRIDLSHNRLESVPEVIYSLPALKSLNLSNNSITSVDVVRLQELPELQELDLSCNNLDDDSKGVLQTINHFTVKL